MCIPRSLWWAIGLAALCLGLLFLTGGCAAATKTGGGTSAVGVFRSNERGTFTTRPHMEMSLPVALATHNPQAGSWSGVAGKVLDVAPAMAEKLLTASIAATQTMINPIIALVTWGGAVGLTQAIMPVLTESQDVFLYADGQLKEFSIDGITQKQSADGTVEVTVTGLKLTMEDVKAPDDYVFDHMMEAPTPAPTAVPVTP